MNLGVSYYTQKELETFGFKKLGKNVQIKKNTTIVSTENISIGDNTRIDDYCVMIAKKDLNIGSYVHIASGSVIRADENIIIGNFVGISNKVSIITISDDFSGKYLGGPLIPDSYGFTKSIGGPVILGNHVWIGIGSIVLPNCEIKEGAAIGAMSLVDRDLSSWKIYLGCPVRAIKQRKKDMKKLGEKILNID